MKHAVTNAPVLADTTARYIVIFKEGTAQVPGLAKALARTHSARLIHVLEYAAKGFVAELSPTAARRISADSSIRGIQLDQLGGIATTRSNVGWGLSRIDQRNLPADNYFTSDWTGAGTNIYLLDGGVNASHPQIAGRVVGDWSFDGGDPLYDCQNHGTAVASIAAGASIGVAPQATIHSVKVMNCSAPWLGDMVAGINWIAGNHVANAVMNVSVGIDAWKDAFGTLRDAITNAHNAGVYPVVAAGNSGTDACDFISGWSPAMAIGAVAVAATDAGDTRPSWSNYGGCIYMFAPGVAIAGAVNDGASIGSFSGTSVAAPFVTGVVALLRQQFPSDAFSTLNWLLKDGATEGVVLNARSVNDRMLYATLPIPVEPVIVGVLTAASGETCTWTATPHGGHPNFTYQWSGLFSATGQQVSGTVLQSGTLTLQAWDSRGFQGQSSMYVSIDPSGALHCNWE
ncbi:MAG: S8 family peptidase [Gemmatimonadaceae bacterium]